MATYKGIDYDKDTDYMTLIKKAADAGDLVGAARAEQQRNAKIAGENSGYAQTSDYAKYLPKTYNGIEYSSGVDYSQKMNDAVKQGNWAAAAEAERQRNAKIDGEGLTQYSKTNMFGSKYSDQLDEILGQISDSVNGSAPTTLPGYTAPSYTPKYDAEIDNLLNQLLNREKFSYNEELDPLYQQYKDMYTKQGQLAMEDTMGQAAALTGGYGSTYSQAVGQQQYNAYLQKVSEMLPEFYNMAYTQYADEGNQLKNLYDMYINRDAVDYQRYQQDVANSRAEYEAAAEAARLQYQQQQDKLSNLNNLYGLISGANATDYERFLNQWNMGQQMSDTEYSRQQDSQKLAQEQVDAILKAGGTPSSSLVSQSGLSSEYIDTLRKYYASLAIQSSGGSGGGSNRYPSDKDYKVNTDGSISVKEVRKLNFDPDEGIFTWNGEKYNSLNSLVDAWNKTDLTDDDVAVLKRKLKSQANITIQ